jgi:hypothetical protein
LGKEKRVIAITFESVLFRPDKPRKDLRELVEAEVVLATQAILVQMRDYIQVTATAVSLGKTLAVAEAVRGKEGVSVRFIDEHRNRKLVCELKAVQDATF